MKRKEYIAPTTEVNVIKNMPLLNVVSNVDGDAGITQGEGNAPGTANGRRRRNDWDDEEEEEDW